MHLVVDGARDQDAAGWRHRLEPGGEVHALAQQILTIDDHIAQMDADAILQRHTIHLRQLVLHLDGTLDRLDDRKKIGDQTVARRIRDTACVPVDQTGEHGAGAAQSAHTLHLITGHQARIPGGIGGHDGGQLASHLGWHAVMSLTYGFVTI